MESTDEDSIDSSILGDLKKERHQEWWDDNVNEIEASGVPHTFTNNGESVLFREKGKPKVDFFPSTGRWRIVGKNARTMGGGAKRFIEWYSQQTE
jgi:hypothetical protein